MCRKCQLRAPALLELRDEALAEWCRAETYSAICAAWGRLGGRVTLHLHGREHFAQIARRGR